MAQSGHTSRQNFRHSGENKKVFIPVSFDLHLNGSPRTALLREGQNGLQNLYLSKAAPGFVYLSFAPLTACAYQLLLGIEKRYLNARPFFNPLPEWLLLGSPMLVDPQHLSQQHPVPIPFASHLLPSF